ncbi:MAG: hypothetical protein R6V01_10060 [Thermoplasmatota archaeon]
MNHHLTGDEVRQDWENIRAGIHLFGIDDLLHTLGQWGTGRKCEEGITSRFSRITGYVDSEYDDVL